MGFLRARQLGLYRLQRLVEFGLRRLQRLFELGFRRRRTLMRRLMLGELFFESAARRVPLELRCQMRVDGVTKLGADRHQLERLGRWSGGRRRPHGRARCGRLFDVELALEQRLGFHFGRGRADEQPGGLARQDEVGRCRAYRGCGRFCRGSRAWPESVLFELLARLLRRIEAFAQQFEIRWTRGRLGRRQVVHFEIVVGGPPGHQRRELAQPAQQFALRRQVGIGFRRTLAQRHGLRLEADALDGFFGVDERTVGDFEDGIRAGDEQTERAASVAEAEDRDCLRLVANIEDQRDDFRFAERGGEENGDLAASDLADFRDDVSSAGGFSQTSPAGRRRICAISALSVAGSDPET